MSRILKTAGVILTSMATVLAAPALAITLNFDDTTSVSSNNPFTGASASVDLSFSDVGIGVFEVAGTVTNTTGSVPAFGAGATEATLTGFGFDLLAGVDFAGLFTSTGNLDTLIEDADIQPFDSLDVAVADNGNFIGGNANTAVEEGESSSFTFQLSSALFLSAADLETAFNDAFLAGDLQASIRFQQVNAGAGSDKLNFVGDDPVVQPPAVPLPAAGWMLLAGVGGIAAMKRRKKV